MRPHRRVFVVAGANSRFLGPGAPDFVHPRQGGADGNPDLEAHLGAAVGAALGDAGATAPGAVDRAFVGNFLGELFVQQGHLGAMLVRAAPGLDGAPVTRVEAACASGGVALVAAIEALQAGHDVALAAGVEVETTVRGSDGVEFMARAAHYARERPLDRFVFPHLFARRARAYKAAFGATDLDLGRVVAQAYARAAANPAAQRRALTMTAEQAATASPDNREFLDDADLRPHIRLADCTPFTDGASAAVLATEAGLARLGRRPDDCTEIVGFAQCVAPLGGELDPTRMANTARAAARALDAVGLTPRDLGVVEVHDCFSISYLQAVEAVGLAPLGAAPAALARGAFAPGGACPVNPGGGLLGIGHPVGATGVRQVVDVFHQLRGAAGPVQVPGAPRHGLTANLGGDDRTAVVLVHRAP
jgi:acetyl-CoA acyltransferase